MKWVPRLDEIKDLIAGVSLSLLSILIRSNLEKFLIFWDQSEGSVSWSGRSEK